MQGGQKPKEFLKLNMTMPAFFLATRLRVKDKESQAGKLRRSPCWRKN
jgi:hypothetical protein